MPYADATRRRQYHRDRQRRRREGGQCVNCGRAALPGLTRCGECRSDHAVRNARRGKAPPRAATPARITTQGPVGVPTPAQVTGELVLAPHAEPGAMRLLDLVRASKRFQQSWDRNRPDLKDQSASSYCRSLADMAVRAGWSDQEVVNMLICWRRQQGKNLKLRERYYENILTRAKELIQREREQHRLEEILAQPPEDEPEALRDSLERLFGVDIIRIVKYLGDPPTYYMYTGQGEIAIGYVDKIFSQPKFREAVGAVTNVVIPKVSGAAWEKQIQAILTLCEDEDIGEASHPDDETRTWVHDYLIERYIRSEDEWEKAAQRRYPFIIGGHIRIFLDDLGRWLDTGMGQKLDNRALAQRLRRIGSDPARVHLQVSGAKTTRNVWILPVDFQPPEREMGGGEDDPPHHRTSARIPGRATPEHEKTRR